MVSDGGVTTIYVINTNARRVAAERVTLRSDPGSTAVARSVKLTCKMRVKTARRVKYQMSGDA